MKKPLICTPIQPGTQKEAKAELKKLAGKVDVAEVWIDQIRDLDVKALLSGKPLPVLVACKNKRDKGQFKGTYSEMAALLKEAMQAKADYVDVPLHMPRELIKKCVQSNKGETIISHHDFYKTPPTDELLKIAHTMQKLGADIAKIATFANSDSDTMRMILLAQTLKEEGIKHILIAMGKRGELSRILTSHVGGILMFAPMTKNKSTAPGQLTVKELRDAWKLIKSAS